MRTGSIQAWNKQPHLGKSHEEKRIVVTSKIIIATTVPGTNEDLKLALKVFVAGAPQLPVAASMSRHPKSSHAEAAFHPRADVLGSSCERRHPTLGDIRRALDRLAEPLGLRTKRPER